MDHVNFLKLWKLCGGENKKGMADSSESDVGLNERTKMVCEQGWLHKHGYTLFAGQNVGVNTNGTDAPSATHNHAFSVRSVTPTPSSSSSKPSGTLGHW